MISTLADSPAQPAHTAYHAVATASSLLRAASFEPIREKDDWATTLRPGGKYLLTRNGSTLVAFTVGARWRPGNPVAMIGAHTDSCCLRIKPVSRRQGTGGFMQVGVETYGGGIWHSWFDRDLGVAGRVLVRGEKGDFVQKLVKIDRPLLRIPTLAIHLDRSTEFKPNKETELFPIAGLATAELNKGVVVPEEETANPDKGGAAQGEAFTPLKAMGERHHPRLLDIVAEELGVGVDAITDFELVLFDTQKGCIGGLNDEFIFAARLDNLGMTYCAVRSLIESVASPDALDNDSHIRLIACFDHEEIGSMSAQGAASSMLSAILRRLSVLPASAFSNDSASETSYDRMSSSSSPEASASPAATASVSATAFEQTLASSFLLSADMAHSVHPNYATKYEASHHPLINGGPVLKINANQRYTTNSPGIVLMQEAARRAAVPLQLFVVRNDSPCGSTIGPMLSASLGVRALDMGNPQLSMHSIRETGGVEDVGLAVKLFAEFLSSYGELEAKIFVD